MNTAKENQVHKATFKEAKTPFWKRAAFPWILILVAIVYASGWASGWVQRSDFANEIKSEVQAIQEVSKATQ